MKFYSSRFPDVRTLVGAKATLAGVLLAAAMPTHAQWGSLLQSVMQVQQKQQAQEQAKLTLEQQEMDASPSKKWSAASEVPADVLKEAQAFAASAQATELQPLYERLYIEGERNATLNFQRIGLTALNSGKLDVAEKAFDAAVARIEMVYADNPEAQKAKSLWSAEKVKDFKGEPYERAMAYFYRGLVYAAKNDFQNARAMFKQADYQDTVAESEKYAGDFALMPYMAGWASYCDGNVGMAKDFLAQAAKVDSRYSSMAIDRPLLVLYETGRAPFKFGSGKFGEQLKWAPHSTPASELKTVCATEPVLPPRRPRSSRRQARPRPSPKPNPTPSLRPPIARRRSRSQQTSASRPLRVAAGRSTPFLAARPLSRKALRTWPRSPTS